MTILPHFAPQEIRKDHFSCESALERDSSTATVSMLNTVDFITSWLWS